MDDSPARPRQVITRIALAIAAVVALTLVVTQPWDAARSAACDEKLQEHVRAQQAFLSATTAEAQAAALRTRNETYAALGTQCGWEVAQAAEAEAAVNDEASR